MSEQAPQPQVHPDVDPNAPKHPEQPVFIVPGEVTLGFSVGPEESKTKKRISREEDDDRLPKAPAGPNDPPEDEYKDPNEKALKPYKDLVGNTKSSLKISPIHAKNVEPDLRSPEILKPSNNN
ncbi:MAG TPA: hypothetical protein PKB09_00765 [Candidatus Saccharibacteria bacterium]|nr:hypothetical protein [Candidatus Saccharibacteria bacterium]